MSSLLRKGLLAPAITVALLLAARSANAGDEDEVASRASPATLIAAKSERIEGVSMRTTGVLLSLGGAMGTVAGITLLGSCHDNTPSSTYISVSRCVWPQIGGTLLTVASVATGIIGIGVAIAGQSKVRSADEKLRKLSLVPNVTQTSAGLSLTGTF